MNHATTWPLLDRFLDCALDNETRWAVVTHLAECQDCRAYLVKQARMRTLVHDRLSAVVPPANLAERIHTAILEASPAPVTSSRRWPGMLSVIIACLTVLFLLAYPWWRLYASPPSPNVAAELAIPHALFAQDGQFLEVTGSPEAVQAWFRDKVTFPAAPLTLPGYELQGGRIVDVMGKRAAQLVYEQESTQHYISLIYFDASPDEPDGLVDSTGIHGGQYGSTAIVTWAAPSSRVALVANLPLANLLRLADQIPARA